MLTYLLDGDDTFVEGSYLEGNTEVSGIIIFDTLLGVLVQLFVRIVIYQSSRNLVFFYYNILTIILGLDH